MSSVGIVWRLSRTFPRLTALAALVFGVASYAPVLVGLLLRQFFDRLVQPGAATPAIWWLLVLVLSVHVIHQLLSFVVTVTRVQIEVLRRPCAAEYIRAGPQRSGGPSPDHLAG